ncbi:MAG TPA: lytic transglycosylase domain-containing protein [Fimbriimonadaceae bacterium]|nr:lytic transglycosylase domain-containing protein [Fimbriimonadaceae bacterium]
MKRLSILVLLVGILPLVQGQSLSEYMKLRKKHGISQAVGVQALETLIGTRVIEVRGMVKGTVRVGSSASILLQKTDGDTLFVRCAHAPDWLSGNEMAVRMIVEATRESENSDVRASLIAAATESSVAEHETSSRPRVAAAKPNKPAPVVAAGKPSREWSLQASDATPIYANFIRRRNARLSEKEAYRIAQGVIGFSLKYGVDARLIMSMVMVESGFNPNATSRAGAMGLGQLMPGTARGMGVSNAYDSIDNLYGTVRLIRGHLDKYKRQTGDEFQGLVLALAAYNAGGGAVSRHGGVPPYRETQNYVKKVTSIYRQLCGG